MQINQFVRGLAEKFNRTFRSYSDQYHREFAQSEIDALALLTAQHREVDTLFNEIENAGDTAYRTKESLLRSIIHKLDLHTKIEEKFFYPAAKEVDKEIVLEANEEHKNVKLMLRRLTNIDARDETFDAQVTTLRELVEHHVKEEENLLFPKCRTLMSDRQLLDIGNQMGSYLERGSTHLHH